jgi:hypothetical protein
VLCTFHEAEMQQHILSFWNDSTTVRLTERHTIRKHTGIQIRRTRIVAFTVTEIFPYIILDIKQFVEKTRCY